MTNLSVTAEYSLTNLGFEVDARLLIALELILTMNAVSEDLSDLETCTTLTPVGNSDLH